MLKGAVLRTFEVLGRIHSPVAAEAAAALIAAGERLKAASKTLEAAGDREGAREAIEAGLAAVKAGAEIRAAAYEG